MRLIIHDLSKQDFEKLFPEPLERTMVIADDSTIRHCLGCFGCWVKTPAACIIRDKYGDMGEHLSKCKEVLIISECFYGGFSPFVKNVLDRSISYVHPYFENRNGEMHHRRRYKNRITLRVWFYGENITKREQQTAQNLVKANCVNLDSDVAEIVFKQSVTEMGGQRI
ncbi:MAG: flavodoxin family protein [Firmicutes bacterium]|nr:flavodoxin family protein [Bacillota bacterium]